MTFNPVVLDTTQVTLGVDRGVALITLNRPKQLNALSNELMAGLITAFTHVNENDDILAVVLTGNGKAFTAGVDLKELSVDGKMMQGDSLGTNSPIVKVMANCAKPIVGAINGFAVTGGFELALACDFLYAAESAKFADTHARVGLIPGWGLSQKLPRLIGINRAREVSFSGNYVSAQEACEWGLVNKVFADDKLLDEAIGIARQIATALPDALYRIKSVMNEGWEATLGEGLALEGERAIAYNGAYDLSTMDERLASVKKRAKNT